MLLRTLSYGGWTRLLMSPSKARPHSSRLLPDLPSPFNFIGYITEQVSVTNIPPENHHVSRLARCHIVVMVL